MDYARPELADRLAGEYVLGTLQGPARRRLEGLLAAHPALRDAVADWTARLGLFAASVPEVTPSPGTWTAIERRLFGAPAPAAQAPAAAGPRWFAWLAGSPARLGGGLAAFAAVLVLSVVLVLQGLQPAAEPVRYVALLQSPQTQGTGWVVQLSAAGDLRLVPSAPGGPVPAGRALQFWTKPEGAAGPTSLGLVRPDQPLTLPAARLPGRGANVLFEITLEPEGGSPYDRPSGPILFVGRTVAL
ncbi:anti-sigma factor [Piscinibacter sakaiensis]|uniref:Anti-sigma K factor RskA C-terminal domain-containing protein n=1 Tax=Piscinibacter sakaiensis TaxID=1547922 RepID=A0A0K8P1Y1_PISS1|nr:anti-sigma factor [Piscinibacter sakaiensis]GAP36633.1 hypothetical protein ISF6_2473 [Piscinibacter sakaiensis]